METKKDSWVFRIFSIQSPTCKDNGSKTYAKSAHDREMVSARVTIPQIPLKGVRKILVKSSNPVEYLERPPILDHMLHAAVKGSHALPVRANFGLRFTRRKALLTLRTEESNFLMAVSYADDSADIASSHTTVGREKQERELSETGGEPQGGQVVRAQGACARQVRGLACSRARHARSSIAESVATIGRKGGTCCKVCSRAASPAAGSERPREDCAIFARLSLAFS